MSRSARKHYAVSVMTVSCAGSRHGVCVRWSHGSRGTHVQRCGALLHTVVALHNRLVDAWHRLFARDYMSSSPEPHVKQDPQRIHTAGPTALAPRSKCVDSVSSPFLVRLYLPRLTDSAFTSRNSAARCIVESGGRQRVWHTDTRNYGNAREYYQQLIPLGSAQQRGGSC